MQKTSLHHREEVRRQLLEHEVGATGGDHLRSSALHVDHSHCLRAPGDDVVLRVEEGACRLLQLKGSLQGQLHRLALSLAMTLLPIFVMLLLALPLH